MLIQICRLFFFLHWLLLISRVSLEKKNSLNFQKTIHKWMFCLHACLVPGSLKEGARFPGIVKGSTLPCGSFLTTISHLSSNTSCTLPPLHFFGVLGFFLLFFWGFFFCLFVFGERVFPCNFCLLCNWLYSLRLASNSRVLPASTSQVPKSWD